jgi:hypothetical protein
MATANKVFVSPGVYTSETDLSFVSQSVGVTTLGIVGETLKGPAFEPIFIGSYDEFQTYFGGTTPEKFVNTQIPKYEAAYIAKSYLQQSNQLFVTRILGLNGYDAGPSWSIKTIANVNPDTIGFSGSTGQPTVYTLQFSGNTGGTVNYTNIASWTASPMYNVFTSTYTTFNKGTSTIKTDLTTMLSGIFTTPANSATTIDYFGSIPGANYSALSSYTNRTNVYGVESLSGASLSSRNNDAWFYSAFDPTMNGVLQTSAYTGYSFYSVVTNLVTGATAGTYTGTVSGTYYTLTGTSYSDYTNLVVATLRSRGITQYSTTLDGQQYQVTGTTDVSLLGSGTAYSAITKNPYATFKVSGITVDSSSFEFETSFLTSQSNYLASVFGTENFAKERTEVPLFLEERYDTLLSYGYNKGYVRGINSNIVGLGDSRNSLNTGFATTGFYLQRYQTPESPWVVSELRGNVVYRLFKFTTISDGNAANRQVKVSLANMSFVNQTFDVIVRDFYDTDSNPVVLEKFTNCSMDPSLNNYVAKKIGTSDGEFEIKSKLVMVEVNYEAPIDALPCGFEGFVTRVYGVLSNSSAFPVIKTKYNTPGEIIYNPPFGSLAGGDDALPAAGDNVRRTYLGISTSIGVDNDFYEYKGKVRPVGDICEEGSYDNWPRLTRGFHMDSGATAITISSAVYTASTGNQAFDCGVASFSSEPTDTENPYYRLFARKFTLLVQGGFDGWDIYEERRTNGDTYALGQSGFKAGFCAGVDPYPTSTGQGNFKKIAVEDGSIEYGNSDYYAYLMGIRTFANPEVTNINVFVTPGIDYVNNSGLVEESINMIENERADSVYIVTAPDFNLLQSSTSMDNLIYPQEAVDALEETGIDSNYTATYYPWVLTRDTVNNTQIYLPATAEVTRNLALTDNIAFPWFATAGYTRGLVNAIRARKRLTQEDRDTLYKGRINPIATFNDVGTVIWGNKTLQVRESALDRINVRRLLLQARKLISAVAVRLLFEQNDNLVRQQFLSQVNPILDAIRRDRGLYDFRVTVSNSPEDLDANQLVGKIYIKPTKALEFIDIEFLITPTGASFEDI